MRSTYAVPSRRRRKQLLDRAKGFYGNSSKNLRVAYDAVDKALVHSYEGRKQKKQQYRGLWIVRINAACRALNVNYSQFMSALKKANMLVVSYAFYFMPEFFFEFFPIFTSDIHFD